MRNKKPVWKYDFFTNELLEEYESTFDCAHAHRVGPSQIWNHCHYKRGIKSPQKPYYFRWAGEPPEPHYVVECYNHDFELLGTYLNAQEASNDTDVDYGTVTLQLREHGHDDLRNRNQGYSGLWFKYKEVK